jgi:hypothetical protein
MRIWEVYTDWDETVICFGYTLQDIVTKYPQAIWINEIIIN